MPGEPLYRELWDFADPEGTETRMQAALPEAEAAGDEDARLQLLTQIARTLGLRRRFSDSHALLDEVEAGPGDGCEVARLRCLLERGRAHNSGGDAALAAPLFRQAWTMAGELGEDFFAVDAAHMLGIVESGAESVAWNERAMALARASDDEAARGWIGSLTNNLAWTHHEMGEFAKALALHEEGLLWQEARGREEAARIARWAIARTLRSMGRLDEALAGQLTLLPEVEGAGGEDGFCHEEIGECLLAQGKEEEARPHFARAHERLREIPWVSEDHGRVERLGKLAAPAP